MRSRLPLLVLFVLASLAAPGCYFTRSPSRPLPALAFTNPRASASRCLVVFLPGFLDTPDSYLDHHFPRALMAGGSPCDAVAVDLHYRYYGEGAGLADVVREDVLEPAVARGYERIWLVGISMGGLGTLLTAQRNADLVEGVILIAPFVGEESTLREIEAAGGAAAWRPPAALASAPTTSDNYTAKLWAWLRGYHTDPDARPPLYIGWGEDDRLGAADRLLAALVPEDHVFLGPGGHNWATWTPIWDRIVRTVDIR